MTSKMLRALYLLLCWFTPFSASFGTVSPFSKKIFKLTKPSTLASTGDQNDDFHGTYSNAKSDFSSSAPSREQREYFEGKRQEDSNFGDNMHRDDFGPDRGYEPPSHHDRFDSIRNEWQKRRPLIDENDGSGRWNSHFSSTRNDHHSDQFPSHHDNLSRQGNRHMDEGGWNGQRQYDHPVSNSFDLLPSHHERMKTFHREPETREEYFDSRKRKYEPRMNLVDNLPDYRDTLKNFHDRPKTLKDEGPRFENSDRFRPEENYRDESEPYYDYGPKPDTFRPQRNYRDESEPYYESGPRPETFRPDYHDESEPFFDHGPQPDLARPSGPDEADPYFDIRPGTGVPYFQREEGFRPLNIFESGYFEMGRGPPFVVQNGEPSHSREIIRPTPCPEQRIYFEEGRDVLDHDGAMPIDDLGVPPPRRRRRRHTAPGLSDLHDFNRYSSREYNDEDAPYELPNYSDNFDRLHDATEQTRRDFYDNDGDTGGRRRRYRDPNADSFLGSRDRHGRF
mmetsp:Transcript_14021/g.21401  ORF Transcript_14021/g.21401 Transcript_14021/m.21401 type:complete len:507 (-) Transcript_14021:141-1661(-)